MKKILISLAVLSVLFSCAEKQKDTEISILPQPQAIRVDEGVFEVDKATKIYMDLCTDEMKRVAGFINEKFAKAAGFELEIVDRMPEENFIAFMNAGMPTESYVINAKPHGVFIDYGDGTGALATVVSQVDKVITFNSVKNFVEGMCIDIYNGSTVVVAGLRIMSVDRTNKTITVDTTPGSAVSEGYVAYVQGSKDYEITGLGAIFGNTATLYGLNRVENGWLTLKISALRPFFISAQ